MEDCNHQNTFCFGGRNLTSFPPPPTKYRQQPHPHPPPYLPIIPLPSPAPSQQQDQHQQYDHQILTAPAEFQFGLPPIVPLVQYTHARRQLLPPRLLQSPPSLLSRQQPSNNGDEILRFHNSFVASLEWTDPKRPSPLFDLIRDNNKTKQRGWARSLLRIPTTTKNNNPKPLRYYDLLIKTTPSAIIMSGFSNRQVTDIFYHAFDMNKASMCSATLKRRTIMIKKRNEALNNKRKIIIKTDDRKYESSCISQQPIYLPRKQPTVANKLVSN